MKAARLSIRTDGGARSCRSPGHEHSAIGAAAKVSVSIIKHTAHDQRGSQSCRLHRARVFALFAVQRA